MSQISPPIRILLVAVIGLCAAYMLFLKPKDETAPATPAPTTAATPVPAKDPNAKTHSKPGAIVQGAVRHTQAASNRSEQAAGTSVGIDDGKTDGTTSVPSSSGVNTNPVTKAPATGQTAAPASVTKEQLASLPRDVRKAVRERKVLVLLFYNNRSADDRAVRRELGHVSRYHGQVFVAPHWIKNVARYQAITRGVDVEQSPTIVVADANLKADTLVGYVDRDTIDQAVVDAIVASGGSLIKNRYFRRIDAVCSSTQHQIDALSKPAAAAAVPAYLGGVHAIMIDAQKKVGAIKAGKAHARFQSHFKGYLTDSRTLVGAMAGYSRTHPAEGSKVLRSLTSEGKKLDKKFVAKNGAHGLSCF